jgi:hypothetical protein
LVLLASGFVLLLLEGKDSTLSEEPLFFGTGLRRGFGERSGETGAGILRDRREREREREI